MRHKTARAAAQIIMEDPHIPLGSPMNGGSAHHGRAQEVILQRTGLRPLRFAGALLASADRSFSPNRTRIRLALYRSAQHEFIAAWSCAAHSVAGENISCHGADRYNRLQSAIAAFEEAEPAFPAEGLETGSGISVSLLNAAQGLARETALRAAFGSAVGMFLYELCITGGPSFNDF